MKKFRREIIYWILWLVLIVIWNYGYPQASPFYDVLIAVLLSIFFIIIKKLSKKNS